MSGVDITVRKVAFPRAKLHDVYLVYCGPSKTLELQLNMAGQWHYERKAEGLCRGFRMS